MIERHDKILLRKALLLEYLTITWNIFEGLVCIVLGFLSGSVALFAYGLESSVEVFASGVVVWELKGIGHGREKKALKLIGLAYLVVAGYVSFDAIRSILQNRHPEESLFGILFLTATVFVMLMLGLKKRAVGKQMNSSSVLANAKFTLVDGGLATTVLFGLVVNAFLGWWWLDPILALFLACVALREGLQELLS